jgi:hypothetical protein
MSQWLAVILLVTGWLVPMTAPHSAADDQLCAVFDGVIRGDQPSLVADSGVQHPGHCAICHAIRSFRTSLTDSGPAATPLTLGAIVSAPIFTSHRSLSFDRLPARAPPQA